MAIIVKKSPIMRTRFPMSPRYIFLLKKCLVIGLLSCCVHLLCVLPWLFWCQVLEFNLLIVGQARVVYIVSGISLVLFCFSCFCMCSGFPDYDLCLINQFAIINCPWIILSGCTKASVMNFDNYSRIALNQATTDQPENHPLHCLVFKRIITKNSCPYTAIDYNVKCFLVNICQNQLIKMVRMWRMHVMNAIVFDVNLQWLQFVQFVKMVYLQLLNWVVWNVPVK